MTGNVAQVFLTDEDWTATVDPQLEYDVLLFPASFAQDATDATRRARLIASRVVSVVTFGLPSRSPPIQVPRRTGVASASGWTPCSAHNAFRSPSTPGSASATIASR